MRTREDVESYLIRMGHPYEEVREGLFVLRDAYEDNIVVSITPPLVVFRLKAMSVPSSRREDLFRELLVLNASELVHGAYGLEEDSIVLMASLQLENLDFNEFQAVVDEFTMAVSNHRERLARFGK
jgi:Tir chaperone family protein CesT